VARAAAFRVVQVAGVESEVEFAYAALQQFCAPLLDGLEALPEPQRVALNVALGVASGDAPDRFMVALAALGLMSAAAEDRPLLCVVDDFQWLDDATSRCSDSSRAGYSQSRGARVRRARAGGGRAARQPAGAAAARARRG
jgi:hypothetical protein